MKPTNKRDLFLSDPSVQAAFGAEMMEAQMSSDQHLKHQQYFGTLYSNLIHQQKCPKCRTELIDSIHGHQDA